MSEKAINKNKNEIEKQQNKKIYLFIYKQILFTSKAFKNHHYEEIFNKKIIQNFNFKNRI